MQRPTSRTFTLTALPSPDAAAWHAVVLEPDARSPDLAAAEATAIATLITRIARPRAAIVAWQVESPSQGEPQIAGVRVLELSTPDGTVEHFPWHTVFVDGPRRLASVLSEAWPFVAPSVYPVVSSAELKHVEVQLRAPFEEPYHPGPVTASVQRWVEKHGAYMETSGTDGVLDRILIVADADDLAGTALAAFDSCAVRLRLGAT